jgi:hypothetical protein
MDKCINHKRRRADHSLIGIPICDVCARAALVWILQNGDSDTAPTRSDLQAQLAIGAES